MTVLAFQSRMSDGWRLVARAGARKELLTSTRGENGVWHAHDPSAHRTLCGLLLSEQPRLGRRYQPTCAACVETALVFDEIDRCAPNHWRQAA